MKVPCIISPEHDAVLDPGHRTLIGYETYFFSDDAAKGQFDAAPEKFCGPLTDPVSLRHFNPNPNSPRLIHNDRLYIFASDSTREMFTIVPGMYQYPEHKMLPVDSAQLEPSPE